MAGGFRAVMQYVLETDELKRLPHVLNVQWRNYGKMWAADPVLSPHLNEWAWCRCPDCAGLESHLARFGYMRLRGPNGFAATVGRNAFELSHSTSWDQFFADAASVQAKLRGTVRLLCAVLGSPSAVYFPADDTAGFLSQLICEGWSLNDIVVWLQKNFGLAQSSIESMMTRDGEFCEVRGYFIDNFETCYQGSLSPNLST